MTLAPAAVAETNQSDRSPVIFTTGEPPMRLRTLTGDIA
jgi:hypothetical protein